MFTASGSENTSAEKIAKMQKGGLYMDYNKFFPVNNTIQKNQAATLVIAIAIYIVASAVIGFVLGFLNWIPLLGSIFGLVSFLFGIYCLVGIILGILKYVK